MSPISNTKDELIVAKICSMVSLTITSFIAGILPIKLGAMFFKNSDKTKITSFERVMSFLLYFGAGVLLCTIFLHLMPDLRQEMAQLNSNALSDFPLSIPDLLVCCGFLFIYSIEQIVHSYLVHKETPTAHQSKLVQAENNFELHNQPNQCISSLKPATSSAEIAIMGCKGIENKEDIIPASIAGCCEHKHIKSGPCDHKNYHACENNRCATDEELGSYATIVGKDLQHHQHYNHHIPDISHSIGSAALIVMALSLHEIFEGVAVGLGDKSSTVWYLLAAISCHKMVLATFIGLQLLATKTKLLVSYILITIYSFTSPLGILVGLLVSLCSDQNEHDGLLSVILQGIATGTLLYVVFFEIYFKNEKINRLSGLLKAFSSVFGFVFMAVLQVRLSE